MSFHKINEDPWYDEDGQLIDEDADEGDWQEVEPESYDPYDTVGS
jgi:hypothetical protein